MSNVLIGIIGVILFIGLALAGAEPTDPQKPGRGNSGEHPGRGEPGPGAWEKGSDRAHNVLERIFG